MQEGSPCFWWGAGDPGILRDKQGLNPSDIIRDHLIHQSACWDELLEITMVAKEIRYLQEAMHLQGQETQEIRRLFNKDSDGNNNDDLDGYIGDRLSNILPTDLLSSYEFWATKPLVYIQFVVLFS